MKIILLFLSVSCGAALAVGPSSERETKIRQLKERAQKNDSKAVLELGEEGDGSVVQMLRELRKKGEKHFGAPGANAQMALAKLGEKKEFDEIVGELNSEDPRTQDNAIEKLTYIGGPKAIKALCPLLQMDKTRRPKWNMPVGGVNPKGKVFYASLGVMAARALAKIVDSPPVPPKEIPSNEDLSKWKAWWESNRAKFEK